MPIPTALLPFLIKAIPHVIGAYKRLRERNPDITDDEVFRLLQADADKIIDRADAWLAEHPEKGSENP